MCVKYVDINGNQNYNPRKHKKGVYRTTAPKVVPLEQQPITDIDMIRNRKKYYPVILQSFKWHKSNINKSIERKVKTEPFKDIYSKFIYICAIIERKLPETLQKIETDKAKELEFWDEMAQDIINGEESIEEAISIQCDKYPDTTYYGKNDYVKEQLTLAIERVKTKEQKKREDEKPEPEPEHNWDSNCNYQHEAEKPHRYDNLW